MKKVRKIAVLVIICLLAATLNVYAASADITLTASPTSVKVGDTVKVVVAANCETGISGVNGILTWDKTKLELTNTTALNGFMSLSDTDAITGDYVLTILEGSETHTKADVAEISFNVLENVVADEELAIKLSEIEFVDSEENELNIEDLEIKIKVVTDDSADEGNDDSSGDDGNNDASGEGESNDGSGDGDSNNGSEDGDNNDGTEDDKNNNGSDDEENNDGLEDGDNNDGTEDGNNNDGSGNNNQPTESDKKDETIADKPINHAGIASYAFIGGLGVIAIAVFYVKCKKYKDIK